MLATLVAEASSRTGLKQESSRRLLFNSPRDRAKQALDQRQKGAAARPTAGQTVAPLTTDPTSRMSGTQHPAIAHYSCNRSACCSSRRASLTRPRRRSISARSS